MANESKCSLNNMLNAVLGFANQEQNQVLPPLVYQAMYNTVTSMLISALVKQYPSNPVVIDMLRPFVKVEIIALSNGYVTLPDDYRDILGTPNISAKTDGSGECGTPITTDAAFKVAIQKAGCRQRPVTILPQSEFAIRTTSTYKFPTYNDAIGYMYGTNKIKVCPYDLTKVELMYVIQEPKAIFGYTVNPDDSYNFDATTSTEVGWSSASFDPMYKALTYLVAAYTRDRDLADFSKVLTEGNILG